ncbi:unnamed protein product [Cylicocyclus nassatus]|uniref:Uncharacterized protein n=1 Tax=Cylicocyclus nassatus TaxID=53992 RepID=A0AA36MEJ0_CYLNA|nr:unnamed protein product [Cylicocyclus nassatus]
MIDPETTSLHTAFVIIYLQELAWISAPLLISANVFLHACLRKLDIGILIFSGSIFAFFLVSGFFIAVSLYFVHSRALGRKQVRYLTPYILAKLFRMLVLGTFSVVILFSPKLIRTYFYASIYGVFECVAGAIALEVTIRSRRLLKRMECVPRRRQSKGSRLFKSKGRKLSRSVSLMMQD